MKEKRINWLVFLIITAGFLIQSAREVTLVALPDEGIWLVRFAVSAAWIWGLSQLGLLLKLDLKGYADAIATATAPVVLLIVEAGLGMIPPVLDNLVLAAIHLLVLIVGGIGTLFVLNTRGRVQVR